MKYIFTFLIFIGLSGSAFGAVGDVYYCENMKTSYIEIDGYVENSSPDTKFKFKWDGAKIIFDTYPLGHSNVILKVDQSSSDSEMFKARSDDYLVGDNTFYLINGEYLATSSDFSFVFTSVGTCSKF